MTPVSLLTRTRRWLRINGIRKSRRLGQHFLIDEEVLAHSVDSADIKSTDIILEIGAGIGTLTRALANQAKHVFAIEKDPMLCQALLREFEGIHNITLIQGDAVKVEWPSCTKLVANLPFSISSPVIFRFLSTEIPIAVIMLQREFAERLTASTATKAYGRLTVMVAYKATAQVLEYIAPECFHPPPEVTSALVRIKRCEEPAFTVTSSSLFAQLVSALFNQRRKKIRTPLTAFLQERGLHPKTIEEIRFRIPWLDHRVEEIQPEELAIISNIIHEVETN
jgi:16S rRNA (adenine1518-N6/adenine1519-N6)-dimethyltransferase